jgi:hypothetical protein
VAQGIKPKRRSVLTNKKPDLIELGKRLYELRNTGIVVPFVSRSIGSWRPVAKECHGNSDHWVINNPGHHSVRGWLYFDLSLLGFARFTSHSVVPEPDGTLIDITPNGASQSYPFIFHPADMYDFEELIEVHQVVSVDHRL